MATPTKEMESRLREWAVWYHEHAKTVSKSQDLKQVAQFYLKAIDGLYELMAYTVDALYELENNTEVKLLVPRGVKLTGDLKDLHTKDTK